MAKNKALKKSGSHAFEEFYASLYGKRWDSLKESFTLENPCAEFKIENYKSYFLDYASVFVSCCLPLKNCKNILDLCAAPGGKTLVISSRMDQDAVLISNERSAQRRNRLISVVNESLPEKISQRINITGFDGSLVCKKFDQNKFDAILLDAPCSSERHVFSSQKHLEQWTAARVKNLSFAQWSLLSSGFLVLKQEGFLLYSTCAVCSDENDNIIKKLLKKYENASTVLLDFDFVKTCIPDFFNIPQLNIEKTEFGYQIFPDKNKGAGPMYFSLIKKIS
ncbi:MAG: RsmB/NOP family class I SAM-dependent RNA methyltransferase [Treponemataceae bacterium]